MKESEIKDLIIRPMIRDDAEGAGALEAAVFSMPWKTEDFIEMIEAPYAYYYVATVEGKVVGVCGLRDIAGEGEITNVVVDPLYRRCNIARKMLNEVLLKARKLNLSDITLEVRVSNEGAIKLYESFGFVGEGVRPRFYEKPTEDALIMWKRDI